MKTEYETIGDLKLLRIENEFAKCALFPEHGGHVAEFAPTGEQDILWLSEKSCFETGKPIRGGIPICWPWFGAHPTDSEKASHGFARIAKWTLDAVEELESGETAVVMSLTDDETTLKNWPHPFKLVHRVVIGKSLKLELTTTNTGTAPFEISQALHTYFNVADIAKIAVSGLDGVEYVDTIDGNATKIQNGPVTFSSEVDRVYLDTTAECLIGDPNMNREIRVSKKGSASTVVWNPWIAKAAKMADFGDDEYKGMVCVETTNAWADARTIAPGESHTISAEIALS
jgi:D-hexose-6-phosphate mutarotase